MPFNQTIKHAVTVIVPLYNKEKFVAECLESILMQEVTFSYHILIIDDGSTDTSPQIIAAFQAKHPEIITIITHKENLGLFSSILEAYAQLETEFYTVLDPDDFWILKTFMQDAVSFLSTYLATNQSVNSYGGNTIQRYLGQDILYNKNTPTRYYTVEDMLTAYAITGAIFYRNTFTKEILEKIQGFQNHWKKEGFRSDLFRYLHALSSGRGYYIDKVVACYRVTNLGLWSGLNRVEKVIGFIRSWVSVIDLFQGILLHYILQCARTHLKKMLALSLPEIRGNERKMLFYVRQYQEAALTHGGQPLHAFCFINPSYTWDEKTFLFVNLANFFSEHLKLKVYYVDYPNGIVFKNAKKYTFSCLAYEEKDDTIDCGEDVHVFTSLSLAFELPKIEGSLNTIYWVEETDVMNIFTDNSEKKHADKAPNVSQNDWRAFIQTNNAKGTLFYRDKRSHACVQECLQSILQENYLSVSTLLNNFTLDENLGFMQDNADCYAVGDTKIADVATLADTHLDLINKDVINIAYIATADICQNYALRCLINNLIKYKTTQKKILHVFGDASGIVLDNYPEIELIFMEDISGEKLENYLMKNIDIVFSHGQALLQAVQSKIPSFICYEHPEDYQYSYYIFLPYAEGLDLTPRLENRCSYQNMHFDTLISDIYRYGKKYDYAMRSYQYFFDSHELSNNACKLLVQCRQFEE